MRVVDSAVALALPWFVVVSVTVMLEPAAALLCAENAVTTRSGRGGAVTVIGVAVVAVELLFSSDSTTAFASSATAIKKWDPGVVSAGIVKVKGVGPSLIPASRAGTVRAPSGVF